MNEGYYKQEMKQTQNDYSLVYLKGEVFVLDKNGYLISENRELNKIDISEINPE